MKAITVVTLSLFMMGAKSIEIRDHNSVLNELSHAQEASAGSNGSKLPTRIDDAKKKLQAFLGGAVNGSWKSDDGCVSACKTAKG
jgi:hypothetical protein